MSRRDWIVGGAAALTGAVVGAGLGYWAGGGLDSSTAAADQAASRAVAAERGRNRRAAEELTGSN